jgi:hypothetical protein
MVDTTVSAEEKRARELELKRARSKRYYAKIKAERPEKYAEMRSKSILVSKKFYEKMSADPAWMKKESDRVRENRARSNSMKLCALESDQNFSLPGVTEQDVLSNIERALPLLTSA